MRTRILIVGLIAFAAGWWRPVDSVGSRVHAQVATPPIDKQAEEFFEREVRPILVEHCQSCHGAKKQELGLRLDSAEGLRKGSESGPVVTAGDIEQSRLITAVRYGDDTKMPPKGKLPAKAIASLEKWVKQGAVWPKEDTAPSKTRAGVSVEAAKDHWAFQPIRSPAIPAVKAKGRVTTSVDSFILARLEAAGLTLSPEADRRTLIRRATFDLHGLPPTPEEVAAFESDVSPDAFKSVIDRLLSSPRYGERWGRHWLDVARYSDTKGYVRLNENPRYPSSWTYRDYVIRSFNDDLPFDTFVLEQLAADLLGQATAESGRDKGTRGQGDKGKEETDTRTLIPMSPDPLVPLSSTNLAALGFLTLGQRFLNSPPDIIDDRIDVVTRGLLGLTVSCARCHDHKFDPVPTRDYYGLYGVFANSVEPRVPPLIVPAAQHAQFEAYLKELLSRSNQLDEYLRTQHAALTAAVRTRAGDYLLAGQHDPIQANFLAVMFLIDASKDLNPVMTQRWARHLEQSRRRHDPVLAPWHELAAAWKPEAQAKQDGATREDTDPSRARRASIDRVARWRSRSRGDLRLNQVVVESLSKSPPQSLAEAAQTYGRLLSEADQRWRQLLKESPAATKLDDPDWEELRQLLMGAESPLTLTIDDVEEFLFVDATTQQQLHAKQRLVTDWIGSPGAAPHAMALEDVKQPTDSHIFIRGNASNPGEIAPRQFLIALTHGERQPFQHGSGRLELARAIASADNPLTARVLVNRVWMNHFGAGLVRTPSDFGLRGERPTHPELLDHLASQFIANGWSLKQLHRQILLSSTYRQQSANQSANRQALAAAREKDPENTLLWSMNRRRLDWESLRDALLVVSGQLDLTMGGSSVDLFAPPFSSRRSVYGFIDRQSLPSALRTFDFAPPDASSPQRHQTTVPQQALFLMNSPFLRQQVQHLGTRPDVTRAASTAEKISVAHRLLFGRPATVEEIALGEKYLSSATTATADPVPEGQPQFLSPWEEYLQALLLSNEFVFVD
ncbi:MAG: PSD1 and planctomycete cytochrome C domain-containing protein [Planctomycetota bacterium]